MKRYLVLIFCGVATLAWSQEERNLRVDVRIEGQRNQDSQGIGVGISDRGVGLQGGQRTVRRSENTMQRLLVMDGGTATLSSIQTQTLRLRQVVLSPYGKVVADNYVYRSLGGGVRVTPHSRGERVVIEVAAEEARPLPNQPMASETLRLSTQISGAMGEWIMIGDDERSNDQQGGQVGLDGVGQRGGNERSSQRVWLRVTSQ